MFRNFKNLPRLERKFVYLLLASVTAFLIYIIHDLSMELPNGGRNKLKIHGVLFRDLERQKNDVTSIDRAEVKLLREEQNPKPKEISSLTPNSISAADGTRPFRHFPRNPSVRSQRFTGPENERQTAVVGAFLHAWNAYKKYAWGHDELKPVSKSWQEWMTVGLTIVDSLDTLIIMGLKQEFSEARRWVSESLKYDHEGEVQLFEMTIRVLGGLLSAFHLSGDTVFLEKARELGNKLMPCFGGVTKIPCNRINLRKGEPSFIEISTAESGSIQLEFTDLSRSTNDSKYEKGVTAISEHIHGLEKMSGLVSCSLNPFSGAFHKLVPVSVGANADSYYEYLLKQWIQTGKTKNWLKDDYLAAVEGIKKYLVRRSKPSGLTFVGSLSGMHETAPFKNEMEHLACFLPGTLALGVMHGLDPGHLELASELTTSCYKMYEAMPTGLSPEIAIFSTDSKAEKDITAPYHARYNIHRPETVESLFYMYRATGDTKYRDYGWSIFQAFEKYTKLGEGYASVNNVERPDDIGFRDKMESFYLAETLKYLYLLFSDNAHLLPLDRYVMNTEAHPLPVYVS